MNDARRVTWLGHSTVLIELDGTRILTDPLLRRRMFHLVRRAGVPTADLDVDAVLVSHVHWDHLDLRSLDRVGRGATVVVPKGAASLLRRRGFDRVVELVPGGGLDVGALHIDATHAEHDVGRLHRGSPLALGFLVRGSSALYFAGDTDLFPAMSELSEELDVALLPVAGWGPTLPPGHMDPRRAAEALRLLRPRRAVPIHWGTYAVLWSRRRATSPAEEFRRHAAELAPEVEVEILPVGGSVAL